MLKQNQRAGTPTSSNGSNTAFVNDSVNTRRAGFTNRREHSDRSSNNRNHGDSISTINGRRVNGNSRPGLVNSNTVQAEAYESDEIESNSVESKIVHLRFQIASIY